MDDGRLEQAETELLGLLASGALRSEAARALASATLARIQLLARHDTKSAFATLFGVGADVSRLPRSVQLEYHLTAAFLHAHSDAQLFLPGKTNHHVALAEPLIGEGQGDHRFFLWYAQLTAAMSLYDLNLAGRGDARGAAPPAQILSLLDDAAGANGATASPTASTRC
ncbi:MAG: hypothetical protein IPG04_16840 [Polyangiaceae bacterium]|nr:hypothetical protein [Polyangiaceae bacterium]